MPPRKAIDDARGLLRRIGLELAFLEPGQGIAPLAELVASLPAALGANATPEIHRAVDQAADWVSAAGASSLERFGAWHAWMEEAVTAWERDQPMPAWPTPLDNLSERPASLEPGEPSQPSPQPVAVTRSARPSLDEMAECQPVVVLPEGFDDELMRMFCVEAEELLAEIENGVLVLEQSPDDAGMLATVFRGFHTLKGNSAVMKLVVLQRLAHELESLLDAARQGRRQLDRPAIDVILAAADVISRYVAETSRQLDGVDTGRSISLPVPALIAQVHTVLATPPAPAHPSEPARSAVAAFLPAGGSPHPPTLRPDSPPPSQQALPSPGKSPNGPAESPGHSAGADPAFRLRPAAVVASTVRVDTHKLDGLVDLVGELVIAQSMVFEAFETSGGDESLSRSLGQLRGITADLQRTAMAMRMIPIRGTFQKMSRLVRDVAVQLGKEIRLVVEGEDTELDRTVIEEIGDPLVHMVRNAADHGIESPADRLTANKSPAGTITLQAFHQGGFVVIRISDDGRGLDPDRIRRKAIEKGLIAADAVVDDRESLELIFAPGFSTAEQVTDVSGRGVGMDVVRRNIERVRGKVEIESVPSRGTCFTISMPLTLAIIEGLIVAVAGQRFVIPTLSVRESFRPHLESITTVHGRGELVDVRGRQVPLLRLSRHLGIQGGVEAPDRGIVVVLEAGYDCRCLLVDELVGKQEVVIKGLGETFSGRSGFAGAAILGDGRVSLILDTTALVRLGRASSETAA